MTSLSSGILRFFREYLAVSSATCLGTKPLSNVSGSLLKAAGTACGWVGAVGRSAQKLEG